jgi:hypothetical protein
VEGTASEAPRIKTLARWIEGLRRNENQLSLILSLIIGALVGLVVVAFILLTGRLAARMYPPGDPGGGEFWSRHSDRW